VPHAHDCYDIRLDDPQPGIGDLNFSSVINNAKLSTGEFGREVWYSDLTGCCMSHSLAKPTRVSGSS
jgi:hypothetical protein